MRWVLGEQSSKQLRGANMQDVIFSGTQNRKPQGYASVAITFDNSDRHLNLDYNGVSFFSNTCIIEKLRDILDRKSVV